MTRRARRLSADNQAAVDRILGFTPPDQLGRSPIPGRRERDRDRRYNFELVRKYLPRATQPVAQERLAIAQDVLLHSRAYRDGRLIIDEPYVPILGLATIIHARKHSLRLQQTPPHDIEAALLARRTPKGQQPNLVHTNGYLPVPNIARYGGYQTGLALGFTDTVISNDRQAAAATLEELGGVDVPTYRQSGLVIATVDGSSGYARPLIRDLQAELPEAQVRPLQFALGAVATQPIES